MRWLVLLLSLIFSIGGQGGVSQASFEVSCTDSNGCFGLLQKTIKELPSGATLEIGKGIYYERSLSIDKNLVLRGKGVDTTIIRAVDSGTLITVKSKNTLSVTLQDLKIETPQFEAITDINTKNTGIVWFQEKGTTVLPNQTMIIKNVNIQSNIGISLDLEKGSLIIQDGTVSGLTSGLLIRLRGDLNIKIDKSFFLGPLRFDYSYVIAPLAGPGISLDPMPSQGGKAQISVERTQIKYWPIGISGISLSHIGWVKTNLILTENEIALNQGIGVNLGGDIQVEFNSNAIHDNEYGILLFLPPCVSIKSDEITAFRGTLSGTGNRLQANKQGNICPNNFPLPPGFTK